MTEVLLVMPPLPVQPKPTPQPTSGSSAPKAALPVPAIGAAKPQKPAQQLINTLGQATNTATVRTRTALKTLVNPTADQANQLLHQNFGTAVAQSANVKSGQLFGSPGIKQLQTINQALAAGLLHPTGRPANIEDLRDLTRYRTQLLADLTDAGSSPAQKTRIQTKLAEAYALAQTAMTKTGRERAGALYDLPNAITPLGEWSGTYHEAGLTLAVTGRTPQQQTIGNTLTHNLIGSGVGELPQLAVGLGAPLAIGGIRNLAGRLAQNRPATPNSTQSARVPQDAQARQQARANAYRYDATAVSSNRLYLDVNPGIRTGETAQQAAARVRAANAELRMRFPDIAKVDAQLGASRSHVMQNDFVARGEFKTGQINFQTGTSTPLPLAAEKGMRIEAIPNNPAGKPIGRFEYYNSPTGPRSGYLPGSNATLPSSGGYDIRFMTETGRTPQNRPKYGETAQWKTGDALPNGYRVQLKAGDIRARGFSGGHSTEAWNEALKTYSDKVSVNTAATRNIFYKTASNRPLDRGSQYTYSFEGQPATQPKTVGSSSQTLKGLEPLIANEVGKKMESGSITGNTTVTVDIPVINRNNKTVLMPVDVMIRIDKSTGGFSIPTWYISDRAFSNKGLK